MRNINADINIDKTANIHLNKNMTTLNRNIDGNVDKVEKCKSRLN